MSQNTSIVGEGNETRVKVTKYGQLVTAPLAYSEPVLVEMTTPGQVYNFAEPNAGESIVITDIIVSADKSVSNTTPADVRIYESDGIDSTTVIKGIVAPQLTGSSNQSYIGLNLLVPEGLWINATTTDASILITIMYYRVPQEFV